MTGDIGGHKGDIRGDNNKQVLDNVPCLLETCCKIET